MDPCSLSVAPASLLEAIDHADAVISTAAGYTRHNKGDIDKIDTIGNRNLADAASQAGVRRFVLTSILTCDQTPQIPHLWHELRSGPDPAGRGFPQWGVRCCRLRDRWVRQAVDLALGRVLRASDRGLFVGVDAGV